MTKTDILIQKDQEIKRLNDQILTLTEKLNNLNILLGSKDELLRSKQTEFLKDLANLKEELDKAKSEQRVIVENPAGKICQNCGYYNGGRSRLTCASCGTPLPSASTTYRNFEDVQKEIKLEVEKKLKKSIAGLEEIQLDLEIKIEGLENDLKRKDKRHNKEIDDLQSKNLDRINEYKEKVAEFEAEIVKIKKNKTDEELEAKRQEEVEKLKAANTKLIEKLVEAEKVGFWRKLFNKLFINKNARKEAIKEVLEANELINKIENTKQSKYNHKKNNYTVTYHTPYGVSYTTCASSDY